jgi:hypothetical protein
MTILFEALALIAAGQVRLPAVPEAPREVPSLQQQRPSDKRRPSRG